MLCGYLSSIEARTIGSIEQLGGVTGAFSRPVGPMAQIVRTPEDAFASFMGTEIGFLLVGNCILHKQEQNAWLARGYKNAFEPD